MYLSVVVCGRGRSMTMSARRLLNSCDGWRVFTQKLNIDWYAVERYRRCWSGARRSDVVRGCVIILVIQREGGEGLVQHQPTVVLFERGGRSQHAYNGVVLCVVND